MSVLLVEKDGSGKVIHRCDARCYNAKGPICECMCNGLNHGKGFSQSVENVLSHSHLNVNVIKQEGRVVEVNMEIQYELPMESER